MNDYLTFTECNCLTEVRKVFGCVMDFTLDLTIKAPSGFVVCVW